MRSLAIFLVALTLAACGGDRRDEGAGKAQGEILPASVSDAMLPVDTVRSQAPLAPAAQASGKEKGDQETAPEASEAASSPETAPATAAAADAE